ncbi:hypothetical protein M569_04651 [Genlisea aurea]|uniref:Hexosyltransferase n=1 Tax=Genlisea aurea TaxID=192259 RepID=S8E328_9LAMI|nr:hypothetical protein M569_04651 [Genlisea aurea]
MMKLHMSPSLRKHIGVLPTKGLKEFVKVKAGGSRRWSYGAAFYSFLFFVLVLRFMFLLTAVDGETKCSVIGCLGQRLGPRILGTTQKSTVPEAIYQVLKEPANRSLPENGQEIPQSLQDFMILMEHKKPDAKTFASELKSMIKLLEERTRTAKIHEYLYRHVASSSIPKQLHCLMLRLANEHSTNANARLQLPSAELIPALVDNSYLHFILASDNVLAASVVATSLVQHSLRPGKIVLHIITDRKSYFPMQAWFSLHPLAPAIVEVKALHHFDWFSKGRVPVLEAMEKDQKVRSEFRGGSSAIVSNNTEKPHVIAAKLQALSPKYNSLMNHIRIHLPELFPSLNKVIFLDDDIVIQTDLSALWDIEMNGKVNGAVETCRGEDKFVMSKRLKNYLNFSHPLISNNFDPEECAWAYGLNIFDLEAWRRTSITQTYYQWIDKNVKSNLSLWQLGTLPPGLIAFRSQVYVIDPFWHMLGLGYQENTTFEEAESAGVIHFNGYSKPWLDIAFPHLRPLWTKYLDFSDRFIKSCRIRSS